MSGDMFRRQQQTETSGAALPQPEPDLTPKELIARAAALREKVRAEQDQSEARGCHSPELQEAFVKAGFYRALQPRRFGGYEFDYVTYYKAMLEICRGDPGTGWCLILGSTHGAQVASHWPEQAQAELFGGAGHFIAPHRAMGPAGRCRRVEGGYLVDGFWNYASGIPYSTHFIGNVMVEGTTEQIVFIVPRKAYEIVGDWGGDNTLGMRASGSNSVKIAAETFVPAHWCVAMGRGLWSADDVPDGTYGTRLHGNPMYLGRMMGPYHASLVATVVGAARAALDELEAIARARKTRFPPIVPWTESADIQRSFGQALLMTDTAEAVLIHACEQHMEYCHRWAADGTPFSAEDSLRLWGMHIHAGTMACDAVDLLFRAASSAAAKKGQRIERYYRDCAMYRSHSSSQLPTFATGVARVHFGLPMGMYGI